MARGGAARALLLCTLAALTLRCHHWGPTEAATLHAAVVAAAAVLAAALALLRRADAPAPDKVPPPLGLLGAPRARPAAACAAEPAPAAACGGEPDGGCAERLLEEGREPEPDPSPGPGPAARAAAGDPEAPAPGGGGAAPEGGPQFFFLDGPEDAPEDVPEDVPELPELLELPGFLRAATELCLTPECGGAWRRVQSCESPGGCAAGAPRRAAMERLLAAVQRASEREPLLQQALSRAAGAAGQVQPHRLPLGDDGETKQVGCCPGEGASASTELSSTRSASELPETPSGGEEEPAEPELELGELGAPPAFPRAVTDFGMAFDAKAVWKRSQTCQCPSEATRAASGGLEQTLAEAERDLAALEAEGATPRGGSAALTALLTHLEAVMAEALEAGCRREPGAMAVFEAAMAATDRAAQLLHGGAAA